MESPASLELKNPSARTTAICAVHPARNNFSWPQNLMECGQKKEIKEDNVAFRFPRLVGSYFILPSPSAHRHALGRVFSVNCTLRDRFSFLVAIQIHGKHFVLFHQQILSLAMLLDGCTSLILSLNGILLCGCHFPVGLI